MDENNCQSCEEKQRRIDYLNSKEADLTEQVRKIREGEINRLLEKEAINRLHAFIRNESGRYEVIGILIRNEDAEDARPHILLRTTGDFVRVDAPKWLRDKLRSIATPRGTGSGWFQIYPPEEKSE